ncbi:hypothetical protein JYU34_004807 [Plutella xylostella]|uniref:Uncharacterized protein n=1 Tax=Plutella xylostella TaxID=51655 RepID=A0ABQ7QYX8_PLUXY|nr:hypothetical protein JYU34_004807 [Plutella xylostella]
MRALIRKFTSTSDHRMAFIDRRSKNMTCEHTYHPNYPAVPPLLVTSASRRLQELVACSVLLMHLVSAGSRVCGDYVVYE